MKLITLEDYSMQRAHEYADEWQVAEPNAVVLLQKVNTLFERLGWTGDLVVSSGFRPNAINQKIPNAAKGSLHRIGKAVDLADENGSLKECLRPITNKDHSDLLRELGLFMENPACTPKWVHLDIGQRADRPSRTFWP